MSAAAGLRRLFVAIDPPPAAVSDLKAVVDTLEVTRANATGASTRVVPPDRWHVTLVFIGEVPVDRVDAAAMALDRACASEAVRTALPVELRFAGGGTFGRGRFTILWARLTGDIAALRSLSSLARRELRRSRLPFDDRNFKPHLTLARPGDRVPPDAIAADVARLEAHSGPPWRPDVVHLIESTFLSSPAGVVPHYTPLHSTPI